MLTAHDLMTESPATVGPTWTIRSAVRLLQTLDVRHLPVVNEQGELVGMISDRDLRALALPVVVGREYVGTLETALDASVSSLMTGDVLSVEEEDPASEIVEMMLEHKIGAVPVTDADGSLVGIVSYIDVLRALPLDAEAAE